MRFCRSGCGSGGGSGCGCSRVFAIFMCFWSTFAKFLFCASDCNFKCVFDRGVRCVSALVSSRGFCSFFVSLLQHSLNCN